MGSFMADLEALCLYITFKYLLVIQQLLYGYYFVSCGLQTMLSIYYKIIERPCEVL